MPFDTWIILATPGIFSSNPLFHLNVLTDQQDLPQPQKNCNSHCLKDLCKNICFSEKKINFQFLFFSLYKTILRATHPSLVGSKMQNF